MPRNGTVAFVSALPPCDICKMNAGDMKGENVALAKYDARTVAGPWANMCVTHFALHTNGELGTGKGQRLEVEPVQTPDDSRPVVDCPHHGRHVLVASMDCFDENMAALIEGER